MKPSVLIIVPGFPKDEQDDQCLPFIQTYVRCFHEQYGPGSVRVLATQYPFKRGSYRWNGIEVYACGGANKRWAKPFTWWRALRQGRRMSREHAPTAIHSFWLGECAWIASRIARACGVPNVITLMGQDARDERNWWRMVRSTDARIVTLSERHASVFQTMSGRQQDVVIPLGIDARDAVPMSATRDIDLLFAGSLIPVKRPERFIEVVKLVSQRRKVRAVMCGARIPEGSTFVDELVKDAGLDDVIEVMGNRSRTSVLELMGRSRVLVHTSRFESQGYVFNEALMQGMHIVSYAVGIAEASERWSVIDDLDDTDRMVEAILEQLDQAGDASSRITHDVKEMVAAYTELYGSEAS
ncbi:MAG TPA: glycosyltransferase family 4 protein [Flavobacteriales bacterium]|nr:glycosyltransferase family 4 protein [Flavobacteriales bacterium]